MLNNEGFHPKVTPVTSLSGVSRVPSQSRAVNCHLFSGLCLAMRVSLDRLDSAPSLRCNGTGWEASRF